MGTLVRTVVVSWGCGFAGVAGRAGAAFCSVIDGFFGDGGLEKLVGAPSFRLGAVVGALAVEFGGSNGLDGIAAVPVSRGARQPMSASWSLAVVVSLSWPRPAVFTADRLRIGDGPVGNGGQALRQNVGGAHAHLVFRGRQLLLLFDKHQHFFEPAQVRGGLDLDIEE